MKQQVIYIDKPIGKTPLAMVDLFKENNPEYKDVVISYAGRLDPMAHGVLLLLIGEENKKRERYLHLDKTYEVEILFGFGTDTYDMLGKVQSNKDAKLQRKDIQAALETFLGKIEQEYPPYSSKTVLGKPLFWWARNNKLGEIEIPKKVVEIFSIVVLSDREVPGGALLHDMGERIEKVQGNFRQEEILQVWKKNIDMNQTYSIVKIQVVCSSGTYMRSLAHELGRRLGVGAIAFDIYRTKVGAFSQNIAVDLQPDLSRKLL